MDYITKKDDQTTKLPTLNELKNRLFDIKIDSTEWFRQNTDSILRHAEQNLYAEQPRNLSVKCRNLVVQGLKGSGKSTLMKFICNELADKKNTIYQYINCQNFMNKTADGIYDQLKLVYEECLWSHVPCLIVLENLDLLIENKTRTIDPSSQLYHAQIVECK